MANGQFNLTTFDAMIEFIVTKGAKDCNLYQEENRQPALLTRDIEDYEQQVLSAARLARWV